MGHCWMSLDPYSFLILALCRERDKALLRSVMVGGVWNGFLLDRVGGLEKMDSKSGELWSAASTH